MEIEKPRPAKRKKRERASNAAVTEDLVADLSLLEVCDGELAECSTAVEEASANGVTEADAADCLETSAAAEWSATVPLEEDEVAYDEVADRLSSGEQVDELHDDVNLYDSVAADASSQEESNVATAESAIANLVEAESAPLPTEITEENVYENFMPVTALANEATEISVPVVNAAEEIVATVEVEPAAQPAEVAETERTDSVQLYPELPKEVIPYARFDSVEHPKILYDFEALEMELSGQSQERVADNLLTEEQLRHFYFNPQLEYVDQFVEAFVQNELAPSRHDPFYDLLHSYLAAVRSLESLERECAQMDNDLTQLRAHLWEVRSESVTQTGRCGDDKPASGTASYQTAKFRNDLLARVADGVTALRRRQLEQRCVALARSEAAALQCRWAVVRANHAFMEEFRVNAQSPPFVFGCNAAMRESASRNRLRYYISTAFHVMRMPALPAPFLVNLKHWIAELVAVLLKSSIEVDQLFLLSHVLRVPISLDEWAPPFVQPTSDSQGSAKQVTDHFLSLLCLLLSPVRQREAFLSLCLSAQADDDSWTIVDPDGEEEESRLVATPESDLLRLLNQFNFEHYFASIVKQFVPVEARESDVMSLFALQLTLMKVLFDALQTYNRPAYRQFCKQLGYVLRQSVQYVGDCWQRLRRTGLCASIALQAEFDRLLLFGVQSLVSCDRRGVWQFLVDLPYAAASVVGLQRIQILLISANPPRFSQLVSLDADACQAEIGQFGGLAARLADADASDGNYVLSAVANTALESVDPQCVAALLPVVFNICFVDAQSCDAYVKVGSEIVASVVLKRPEALGHVIQLMDRNLDRLAERATDVLTLVRVERCAPTEADVIACGKWLLARPPDSAASTAARRLLRAVDWRSAALPPSTHAVAAETIARAHATHCKTQSSLIAASIRKASKLVSRVPDVEQQFDSFCWDVVLQLRLDQCVALAGKPLNDVVAYYSFLIRNCLQTPVAFLGNGVGLFNGLLNASSFYAAAVALSQIVNAFSMNFVELVKSQMFLSDVDRLVHADQSSLPVSLVSGSQFPGKLLTFLSGAITSQMASAADGGFAQQSCAAWVALLTAARVDATDDQHTLFLLDALARAVFARSIGCLASLRAALARAHRARVQSAAQASRGLVAWLTGDDGAPPPLLASNAFGRFAWLAFVAVLAETDTFAALLGQLNATLIKQPQATVENALKKASAKTKTNFSVERLPFYRWMDLCCALPAHHPLVPLVCQQLAVLMLRRISSEQQGGQPSCVGLRFLRCRAAQAKFEQLKNSLNKAVETKAEDQSIAELLTCIKLWLWDTRLYSPYSNAQVETTSLDYLLELIKSGDTELWNQYVDTEKLETEVNNMERLYKSARHMSDGGGDGAAENGERPTALGRLLERVQTPTTRALPPPQLPTDELVPPPDMPVATFADSRQLLNHFGTPIESLVACASGFAAANASLQLADRRLIELLPHAYTAVQVQVDVSIRCSQTTGCKKPLASKALVTACQYSTATETALAEVDGRCRHELADLDASVLRPAALHLAVLEESLRCLDAHLATAPSVELRQSAVCLFYHVLGRHRDGTVHFPLTRAAFGHCIDVLGQRCVANEVDEQEHLLASVIQRTDLSDWLVPNFAPHICPMDLFLRLYDSIFMANRSGRLTSALTLALLSKVDLSGLIQKTEGTNEMVLFMQRSIDNATFVGRSEQGALFSLVQTHFQRCCFFKFPEYFVAAVDLLLQKANEQDLPTALFAAVTAELSEPRHDGSGISLNRQTAREVVECASSHLARSREQHDARFYLVWRPVVAPLSRLLSFVGAAALPCPVDCSPAVAQQLLVDAFGSLCRLFGVWLSPPSAQSPPWPVDDGASAAVLVSCFVQLLQRLHAAFERALPPLSLVSVPTLFWRYYAAELANVKASFVHVHQLYREAFLKLPWNSFCPDVQAMQSMRDLLSARRPDVAAFVTDVFVRTPWLQVVQHCQPEARVATISLLFDTTVRCCADSANYADCKASMPLVLDSIGELDWQAVPLDDMRNTLDWLANFCSAAQFVLPTSDVLSRLHCRLLRPACRFVSAAQEESDREATAQRRALYARLMLTVMTRLLNDGSAFADRCFGVLCTLLDDTSAILDGCLHEESAQVAAEFVASVGRLSSQQACQQLCAVLKNWLLDHPDSPLVLLLLRGFLQGSAGDRLTLLVGLTESAITAYFHRNAAEPSWAEVCEWLRVPPALHGSLHAVCESERPPLLTLNGALQQSLGGATLVDENAILHRLMRVLGAMKPKLLAEEAALLLLAEKAVWLTARQCEQSTDWTTAAALQAWFERQGEDKQASILHHMGLAKRHTYSARLKLVCQLMANYLAQQQTGEGRRPRTQPADAVTSARVSAVRDLRRQKQWAPFAQTVDAAVPVFLDPAHHIGHATALHRKIVHSLYIEKYLHLFAS